MKIKQLILIFTCSVLISCGTKNLTIAPNDPNYTVIKNSMDHYFQTLSKYLKVQDRPNINFWDHKISPANYSKPKNQISFTPYTHTSEAIKKSFDSHAAKNSNYKSGKELYDEFMYKFQTIHLLGHVLQNKHEFTPNNDWDYESQVNTIAIALLRDHPLPNFDIDNFLIVVAEINKNLEVNSSREQKILSKLQKKKSVTVKSIEEALLIITANILDSAEQANDINFESYINQLKRK